MSQNGLIFSCGSLLSMHQMIVKIGSVQSLAHVRVYLKV